MKPAERAKFELLVREIQDALTTDTPVQSVKEVLEPWIVANGLHPEKVQKMTKAEFDKFLAESQR